MKIEIDPSEVVTHFSHDDVAKLECRGFIFELVCDKQMIEYGRCQAKRSAEFVEYRGDARAFEAMLCAAGADYIRDRVSEMSAHERIAFMSRIGGA